MINHARVPELAKGAGLKEPFLLEKESASPQRKGI